MKFLDQAKIYIASGHGGPGSISFRREAHVPFGGPDGCLLYTSPSPRDVEESRMPSSA